MDLATLDITLTDVKAVAEALGVEKLTPEQDKRASSLIRLVSQQFCVEARQNFKHESLEETLMVKRGALRLSRPRVLQINSIQHAETGEDFEYVQKPLSKKLTGLRSQRTARLAEGTPVRVVYSAGWEEIPSIVRSQVTDEVARLLRVSPKAQAGATQSTRTAGPYTTSETYATWAVGGQALLSPTAIKLAHQFRPPRLPRSWQLMPPC